MGYFNYAIVSILELQRNLQSTDCQGWPPYKLKQLMSITAVISAAYGCNEKHSCIIWVYFSSTGHLFYVHTDATVEHSPELILDTSEAAIKRSRPN